MTQSHSSLTSLPATQSSGHNQGDHLQRAKTSIKQILKQIESLPLPLQTELQTELGILSGLELKLNQRLLQIAAFGFVSRGKSAVLNALFAEPIFPVGPLNGETQWPRSVRWSPSVTEQEAELPLQIELIDTPGLDEIEGQGRAQMAQEIAHSADLILFIVAGPPTALEWAALKDLRQAGRPLLVVVNKADLYPELDAAKIHDRLQDQTLRQILAPQDILLTSAAPTPVEVRVEWPDGRTTTDWESRPGNIEPLRAALLNLIHQEGRFLLSLNTLLQAQRVERGIADQVQQYQSQAGKACTWQYARLKAALIAVCPLGFIDVGVNVLADLLLIGTLVKLYQLPTHRHQVNQLWGKILMSLVGLVWVEVSSYLLFDITDVLALGLFSWMSTGIVQGCAGLYGSMQVGKQTQTYLVNGCTWGPLGPSTIARDILDDLKSPMILYRLRQELCETLTKY